MIIANVIVVFHLRIDVQASVVAGELRPGKTIQQRHGGVPRVIEDLHVGTNSSLGQFRLATEHGR